uniref:Uncharacterized protein n=1 Tax=Rhizophora mucronata TaxID=61149 RepID=A0A2P2PSW3_RHIMU
MFPYMLGIVELSGEILGVFCMDLLSLRLEIFLWLDLSMLGGLIMAWKV